MSGFFYRLNTKNPFQMRAAIRSLFADNFRVMLIVKIAKSVFQNRLTAFLRKVDQKFNVMNR